MTPGARLRDDGFPYMFSLDLSPPRPPSSKSFFLILSLIFFRDISFLPLILNFDHKKGPKNLSQCFPYVKVLTLGIG